MAPPDKRRRRRRAVHRACAYGGQLALAHGIAVVATKMVVNTSTAAAIHYAAG